MKSIEGYIKEMEEDTTLSTENAYSRQLKHPSVHHKWAQRKYVHSCNLYKLKTQLEEYIRSNSDQDKKLNKLSDTKLRYKFSNTEDAILLKRQITEEQLILDYINDVMEIMKAMHFGFTNIKNFIKDEFFMMGD